MFNIILKPFSELDIDRFVEMSKTEYSFSNIANNGYVRWKHIESPYGPSIYIALTESNRIVGRTLAQPRILRTATKKLKVTFITDMLIDRKFRTTPVNFVNLIKTTGKIPQYDLVYHTSNENSELLYSQLLQYPKPFALKGYAFPLRFSAFFAKIIRYNLKFIDWISAPWRWLFYIFFTINSRMSNIRIIERHVTDAELESLSDNCLKKSGPMLERTQAFLKWRILNCPFNPGKLYRIEKCNKFIGYIATQKVDLEKVQYLLLTDFLLDANISVFTTLTLRLWLIHQAIREKVDAFFALANPVNRIARKCLGFPFIKVPDRFLPHVTPIYMRPYDDSNKEFKFDRSVHMTLADIDYF